MKSHKATNNKNYNLVTILIGFIFVTLSIFASSFSYFSLDLKTSEVIQGIHGKSFFELMNYISRIGDDPQLEIVVGLAVLGLFFTGRRLEAIRVAFYSVASAFVGILIKNIVGRPRPSGELVQIYEKLFDYSFPSLHVLFFTTFFGYLIYLSLYKLKNYWIRFVTIAVSSFLILTIGLSRIYLGAHWASDVLGGYLLGALFIRFIIHAER